MTLIRKCSTKDCHRQPILSDRGVLFGLCHECLDALLGAIRR